MNISRARLSVPLVLGVVLSFLIPDGAPTLAAANDGDAVEYAKRYGVSVSEAEVALRLQGVTGDLEAELRTFEADTFGGLWIEHEPEFQVFVAFTENADGTLARHLPPELGSAARTLTVGRSLAQLVALSDTIRPASGAPPFDLRIVEKTNTIEVMVASAAEGDALLAARGIAWPSQAKVRIVASLARPTADIYAGLDIGGCTSGFTVRRNGTSTTGITTAGHCGSSQSYQGTALPFQWESFGGPNDEQWHTTPGFTDRNWTYNNAYTIAITAKRSRDQQSVGMFVCHMGQSTLYGCGEIENKSIRPSYVPNATATFIQVSAFGYDLSSPGDSGGPWWTGNTALGVPSGQICLITCNDALYVATNYVEGGLGVTILTS